MSEKKVANGTVMSAEGSREMHLAAQWWIPRLLRYSTVMAVVSLVFSICSLAMLSMSGPLPFVRAVTDSGVVEDVNATQR